MQGLKYVHKLYLLLVSSKYIILCLCGITHEQCMYDALCLLILIISLLLEQLTVFQKLNRGHDLQAGKLSWSDITEFWHLKKIFHNTLPKNSACL